MHATAASQPPSKPHRPHIVLVNRVRVLTSTVGNVAPTGSLRNRVPKLDMRSRARVTSTIHGFVPRMARSTSRRVSRSLIDARLS